MQLIRTTVRLTPQVKKIAETLALEKNTSFQDIVERSITHYADDLGKKRAKKIIFKTHNLGVPLDKLTRDDIYGDPDYFSK